MTQRHGEDRGELKRAAVVERQPLSGWLRRFPGPVPPPASPSAFRPSENDEAKNSFVDRRS